jgi:putative peptidoglycan lipid II flippase
MLGEGYLSYYENAYMLQQAPILLVGTAISTAAFPRLANRLSQGRPDLFRRDFLKIVRVMIWIALPVVVIAYFARGYLARLIFSRNAPQIALILGFFSMAIFFRIMYTIVSRYFYAYKDTMTPLFVSIFAIVLNVFLAITLAKPTAYGVTGLAMAQSIVAFSEVFILVVVMIIRDPKLFDKGFLAGLLKIVSVTGFTLLAAFITISFLPLNAGDRGFIVLGTKLFVIIAVTFATHVAVSWLFGLEEVRPVINKLRRLIFKPIKTA